MSILGQKTLEIINLLKISNSSLLIVVPKKILNNSTYFNLIEIIGIENRLSFFISFSVYPLKLVPNGLNFIKSRCKVQLYISFKHY